ncbi:hypothetical protein ACWGNE_02335 [Streptomyces xiamenensis]
MTAKPASPPRWWAHPLLIPAAPLASFSVFVLPGEHGWGRAALIAVLILAAALAGGVVLDNTGPRRRRTSDPS